MKIQKITYPDGTFYPYSVDNLLKTIYKNGEFFNQTTLTEIRERLKL